MVPALDFGVQAELHCLPVFAQLSLVLRDQVPEFAAEVFEHQLREPEVQAPDFVKAGRELPVAVSE